MLIVDKAELKKAFKTGSVPTQEDFENLIDSMVHKHDNGFISQEDGLRLSPQVDNSKLMSFFEDMGDFSPRWSLEGKTNAEDQFNLKLLNKNNDSVLAIQADGKIGVGTATPSCTLDVNGTVAMNGRVGTYAHGIIPADGDWYAITPKLTSCHAFEVVAKVSKPGQGLHAMVHAIALATFGGGKNKLNTTHAHYGSFFNKIDLRWNGSTFNYRLDMRTRRNYGKGVMIRYHVTNLFPEEVEG